MKSEREGPPSSTSSEAAAARSNRAAFRIDAIASGFVGAVALAVSTYNVYLQREQIRAQVWPNVEWAYSEQYGDGRFEWQLRNTGVGPAIVKAVRISIDGKPVESWEAAVKALEAGDPKLARPAGEDIDWNCEGLAHRVIPAGVLDHPLTLEGAKVEDKAAFRRAFTRLKAEICYCSTLGECWLMNGHETVRECPTDGVPFQD